MIAPATAGATMSCIADRDRERQRPSEGASQILRWLFLLSSCPHGCKNDCQIKQLGDNVRCLIAVARLRVWAYRFYEICATLRHLPSKCDICLRNAKFEFCHPKNKPYLQLRGIFRVKSRLFKQVESTMHRGEKENFRWNLLSHITDSPLHLFAYIPGYPKRSFMGPC
jgi:hypothetical protein